MTLADSLTLTLTSAPDAPGIISAILRRLIPRVRFILREWIFRISRRAYNQRHISYEIPRTLLIYWLWKRHFQYRQLNHL